MKQRVYIETTIVSYLTARPTYDVRRLAHQGITRDWWENERSQYDLFISETVLDEAADGDKLAAQARLAAIDGFPTLKMDENSEKLAEQLIKKLQLPEKALLDGFHIAIAAVNGMDFLLTWNCTHINNAHMRNAMRSLCIEFGYEPPIICTPEELQRNPYEK